MSTTCSIASIASLEAHIAPVRARLTAHPLYQSLRTPAHLRRFLQSHVFAVWDFMSLLKALQRSLTCTIVPWRPTALPESRRFINEIVFGEESDLYYGRAISHFELYLEAMQECGASTAAIDQLLAALHRSEPLESALHAAPPAAQRFVASTFRVIESGSLPAMAAAFTFGREDVIPDIFRALVHDLNRGLPGSSEPSGRFDKLIWYLERHIEVDGEDHGPLSLRMVSDLCGDDPDRWQQAATAAEDAILARIALWDGILADLNDPS